MRCGSRHTKITLWPFLCAIRTRAKFYFSKFTCGTPHWVFYFWNAACFVLFALVCTSRCTSASNSCNWSSFRMCLALVSFSILLMCGLRDKARMSGRVGLISVKAFSGVLFTPGTFLVRSPSSSYRRAFQDTLSEFYFPRTVLLL